MPRRRHLWRSIVGDGAKTSEKNSAASLGHPRPKPVPAPGPITKFARTTSIIGPSLIIDSKTKTARTIWIVLFLAALVITLRAVVDQCTFFVQCPVTILIGQEYDSLAFPAVTVCNINPIRRSKIPSLPDSKIKTLLEGLKRKGNETDLNVDDQFDFAFSLLSRTDQISAGHEMKVMLLTCTFAEKECKWNDDFTLHLSSTYGDCYSFNAGDERSRKSQQAGRQHGLSLVLFLEQDEQVEGLDRGSGIRLALSEQKLPNVELDGIYVGAGTDTDIGIRLTEETWLEKPCGECDDSKSDFKADYKQPYNKEFCERACVHKHIVNNCDCYDSQNSLFYPASVIKGKSTCTSDKEVKCMIELKRKSFSGRKSDSNLTCDCPNHCHARKFSTEISSIRWPSSTYINDLITMVCDRLPTRGERSRCTKRLKSTKPQQQKRDNFLKVNVFYSDLNYQTIKETKQYPFSRFIPDLGGSIGLYLGLSILGVFELIPLFYYVIRAASRKCRKGIKHSESRSGSSASRNAHHRPKPIGPTSRSERSRPQTTSVKFHDEHSTTSKRTTNTIRGEDSSCSKIIREDTIEEIPSRPTSRNEDRR